MELSIHESAARSSSCYTFLLFAGGFWGSFLARREKFLLMKFAEGLVFKIVKIGRKVIKSTIRFES